MDEAQLLVGGAGDLQADLDHVPGLVGANLEAQGLCVDDGETVAAIGGVDLDRTQALDFDPGIEAVGERRHVLDFHPLDLAVLAIGHGFDQAARGLEHQPGLRFGHWQDAAVEQHGGHAQRVGTGHRRGIGRFHDDPGHLRPRVLGRDQQVDVTEHPAARFVEHEIAQGFILGDPARLFPHRGTRRRGDAADNHIADLTFGVAADHMNDFR